MNEIDLMPPKIERKETGNYIFPAFLANAMNKISIRIQYEAGLMSMTFIMMGMIVFSVYIVFFTKQAMFFKIMIAVNSMCGFILLSSYLITTYQAYKQYLIVMGIIKPEEEMKGG